MTFWDTSAISPLLWDEADSARRRAALDMNPVMVVWYGTPVELESAISRRIRESILDAAAESQVRTRLGVLARSWVEVEPLDAVRERAVRLLRTHPLRAGDALQLGAALVATGENPGGCQFLTADARLATAARKEGFTVF